MPMKKIYTPIHFNFVKDVEIMNFIFRIINVKSSEACSFFSVITFTF
jgi:hypothetical protein